MKHPFLMFLDHARRSTVGRTPGRVISSSKRILSDNTQQSQEADIHDADGIRIRTLRRRATTGTGERKYIHLIKILPYQKLDIKKNKKISYLFLSLYLINVMNPETEITKVDDK